MSLNEKPEEEKLEENLLNLPVTNFNDPTDADIAGVQERIKEVQQGWSPRLENTRRVIKDEPWYPPNFTDDLQNSLGSKKENKQEKKNRKSREKRLKK